MPDCKACHEWFGSSRETSLCPACQRAAKRLFGSQNTERCVEIISAEQQGRLVVLPCKVGDTVWGVVYDTRDCPNCVGIGGCFGCSKANPIDVYRTDFKLHMVEEIGRTLFLTRAEAEKAMEVRG